jgi:hypothetical protein
MSAKNVIFQNGFIPKFWSASFTFEPFGFMKVFHVISQIRSAVSAGWTNLALERKQIQVNLFNVPLQVVFQRNWDLANFALEGFQFFVYHFDMPTKNSFLNLIIMKILDRLKTNCLVFCCWPWFCYFILSYEAGFYKPTAHKVNPPIYRITAYATVPG